MDNSTWVATTGQLLILVGFFSQSKHPALLCVVIFVIFLMALSGNSILILLIHSNAHLQTPMYFFISQLSLMDVMYISVTVLKMLMDQVMGVNEISASECGIQMFLYLTLVGSEFSFWLPWPMTAYVAICHPLRYSILMNHECGHFLVFIASSWDQWMASCSHQSPWPSPSADPETHHFFCEVPAVMKLSCSDTSLYERHSCTCAVSSCSSSLWQSLQALIYLSSSPSTGWIQQEGRKKAFTSFVLPTWLWSSCSWSCSLYLHAPQFLPHPWEGYACICILHHTHSCS